MSVQDATPGLPDHIFGTRCSFHRVRSMKAIFSHFGISGVYRDSKPELLKKLAKVEQLLPQNDQQAIRDWLYKGGNLTTMWRDLANVETLTLSLESMTSTVKAGGGGKAHMPKENGKPWNRKTPRKVDSKSNRLSSKSKRKFKPGGEDSTQRRAKVSKLNHTVLQECCVCAYEYGPDKFPSRRISMKCSHKPSTCSECLSQALGNQINDKPWEQISCPECPALLSFSDVKTFADPADFNKYDRKSLIAEMSTLPNFTYCLGPGCDDGQIHEGGDAHPIMTCTTCRFQTCFTHKMPWHTGQTCKEYDNAQKKERREQEKASQKTLREVSSRCPGCGTDIQKKSGCDHMTCTQCRTEFCYLCRADYKEIRRTSNAAHKSHCRYYVRDPTQQLVALNQMEDRNDEFSFAGVAAPAAPAGGLGRLLGLWM